MNRNDLILTESPVMLMINLIRRSWPEFRMRLPVPQITIVLLLIHTALGCCWHHAHECIAGCCDSQPVVENVCPCGSHEHEEQPSSQEPHEDDMHTEGDHDRHEHDCDGEHCTFVRSDRSPEECGEGSIDATFLSWDASLQEGNRICAPFRPALDYPTSHSGPPVRSHLLLGVLLI